MPAMKRFDADGHTIFWGDALDVLATHIEDASIDLIFADPPYNIGKDFGGVKDRWQSDQSYVEWCYRWIDLCVRKLKPAASMYVMASTQTIPYLDIYIRKHLTILSRIVWYYDSSSMQARRHYGSLYEPILFCVKDKTDYTFNTGEILVEAKTGAVRKLIDYRKPVPSPYNSKKVPGNVWEIPRVRYRMPEYEDHPTQKPTALLERIIKASTNEGDTVMDPFSGTFTTSFVARQLGRKSIGIEIHEQYLKIGLRRLEMASLYKGESLTRARKSFDRRAGLKRL